VSGCGNFFVLFLLLLKAAARPLLNATQVRADRQSRGLPRWVSLVSDKASCDRRRVICIDCVNKIQIQQNKGSTSNTVQSAQVLTAFLLPPAPPCAEARGAIEAVTWQSLLRVAIDVKHKPIDANDVTVAADHKSLSDAL
jgi:hypothetical protein